MPGENLTRVEASQRSALISTNSYVVELDLTADAKTFPYKSTVTFSCLTPGAETFIDAITDSVSSIELNG